MKVIFSLNEAKQILREAAGEKVGKEVTVESDPWALMRVVTPEMFVKYREFFGVPVAYDDQGMVYPRASTAFRDRIFEIDGGFSYLNREDVLVGPYDTPQLAKEKRLEYEAYCETAGACGQNL